jgi:hypothetical protein
MARFARVILQPRSVVAANVIGKIMAHSLEGFLRLFACAIKSVTDAAHDRVVAAVLLVFDVTLPPIFHYRLHGRITSNRVSSRQLAGTPQGATINPARLNLDSSGAYEVASRTADSSHVPFALVSYTLRTNERGDAAWIVTLQNQNRRPVGTIYIGANKGTVTRTEGMFAGAPMDAVVEDRREGDVEDEEHSGDNPIMRSVRQTFYRAREQAQETFKRVRHNFADYIRGND